MVYKRKRFIFQVLLVSTCFLLAAVISSGALYTQTKLKERWKQERPYPADGEAIPMHSTKKGEVKPPENGMTMQVPSTENQGEGRALKQYDGKGEKRKGMLLSNGFPFSNSKSFYTQQLLIIVSAIIIVLAIVVLYRWKRRVGKSEKEVVKMNNEQKMEEITVQQTFSLLPANKIRAAVARWERTLPQYEQRRRFETIQQWLFRIKKNRDIISIYEDVRYGYRDASSEDVEEVKKWTEEN
ncbi:hypothetical protein COE51_19700 [Bacillus pseudomycoides]|nr:hypothetical protein COE51_19700 [Bacillus pseudomycoides]